MYELLIAGGGLHGIFFANAAVTREGFDPAELAIADPNPRLAALWKERTHRVGMRYLRSTSSHNLDTDYRTLRRFARVHRYDESLHFIEPYARPSVELFNHQLETIIAEHSLDRAHVRSQVIGIEPRRPAAAPTAWRVQLEGGESVDARRVILALGSGALSLPDWACGAGPHATHLFAGERDLPAECACAGGSLCVIGGGISAWQAALRYRTLGARSVTLVSMHPLTESMFDSHPGYIGPKHGIEFLALSPAERLERLRRVRYPGTVPPELAQCASEASRRGDIHFVQGKAVGARHSEQRISVLLRTNELEDTVVDAADETIGPFDRLVFATGNCQELPGGPLIAAIAESTGAMCLESGHPILDDSLQIAPRLHVAGRAAELLLGPAAGNIVGAHLAFRRLRAALRRKGERDEDAHTPPAVG